MWCALGFALLLLLAVVVGMWMMTATLPPLPFATIHKQPEAPRQNVLLLIADDFKPVLKAYQAPKATGMANLDQLSRDGITFRNAHCQMSICGPSRASFLTSLRPDTLGVYYVYPNLLHKYIHRTRQTGIEALLLPQLFKLAGYQTFGVGKVFHENEYMLMGSSKVWTEPMYGIHKRSGRPKAFTNPYSGSWISHPEVADDFFPDGQAAQLAANLITQRLGKAPPPNTSPVPWFLAVGLWKPHLPWTCPKRYADMAGKVEDYLPHHHLTVEGLTPEQQAQAYGSGCSEIHPYNNGEFTLDKRKTGDDNLAKANHAYHAAALYMDAQMGIVLDALDRSHSRSDTIVVFLGDHGFHLGDHGLFCKHTNFEQATKVPFIIRPSLRETHWQRGVQAFAPVELLDLMPTLYDLAKLPLDLSPYQKWEGTSLLPILTDPDAGHVKFGAVSQFAHKKPGSGLQMGYSIRTTRYRLTTWPKFHELYDYLEDEWETQVVRNASKKQVLVKGLQQVMHVPRSAEEPFDFDQRGAIRAKPAPKFS